MRRLAIGLVAAAAVIAPLLTSAAASASPAAARPKIFSAEQAGAAIGAPRVQYRYVETTFTLPKSSKLPYTSGAVFSSRFADPGAAFSSVRVGAEFAVFPAGTPGSAFTAPAQDFRLVLLSGTKVTQKNGTKVSLVSSSQVIETSNGTKTGTVQVNAPTVYNNGQNTGIWVRH